MTIESAIETFEEIRNLSDKDRAVIIENYKKGYHFLIFYGKFIVIGFLIVVTEFFGEALSSLAPVVRIGAYIVSGYLISAGINLIEINFISKKVIRDLIKDLHNVKAR
jgi:hypothetical protein